MFFKHRLGQIDIYFLIFIEPAHCILFSPRAPCILILLFILVAINWITIIYVFAVLFFLLRSIAILVSKSEKISTATIPGESGTKSFQF